MFKARIASILVLGGVLGGCGRGMTPAPVTPTVPTASVSGQYNMVLTSSNGNGTTNIYTNFTQTGTTFAGAANTLVCPSNDLSKCGCNNAAGVSISPVGTVDGASLKMTISYPSSAGDDTITLVGTTDGTNLAGTYSDSLGDAGSWAASSSGPLSGIYSGTFNSTSNPLPITPNIMITLTQNTNFQLTGTATITNSPCISSLTFSGQAIGGASSLTDSVNGASLVVLPDGNNFNFSYNFDPTAAHCAGDYGRGVVTSQTPWDY